MFSFDRFSVAFTGVRSSRTPLSLHRCGSSRSFRLRFQTFLLLAAALAACERPSDGTVTGPGDASLGADGRFDHLSYGDSSQVVPDQYIVFFDRSRVQDVRSVVSDLVEGRDIQVHSIYERVIRGFWATIADDELVATVEEDERVERVVPNEIVWEDRVLEDQTSPLSWTPRWWLSRINQRELPLQDYYAPIATGAGVSIYVVDTGIYPSHQEFEPDRVQTSYFDGYPADTVPQGHDCTGHGTRVASAAAGESFGSAPEALLYSVRVIACDGTRETGVVLDGLEWIMNHHDPSDPAVGTVTFTQPNLENAIETLADSVGPIVISAGQGFPGGGDDACKLTPQSLGGSTPGVLSVAASNDADERWWQSNYGSCVDLFAPGEDLVLADIPNPWDTTDLTSGTSYSAPLVGGIAAIHLEEDPQASAAQITDLIVDSATVGELSDIGSQSPNRLAFVPRAVFADITGPMAPPAGTHWWQSNPDGGDLQAYDVVWERKQHWSWGSGPWGTVGSSESLELQLFDNDPDFSLRVTVTSAGQEAVDTMFVFGPCNENQNCP